MLSDSQPIRIAPGQVRAAKFKVEQPILSNKVTVHILYHEDGSKDSKVSTTELEFNNVAKSNIIHKFTYLHPSGIVSYGLICPPSQKSQCQRPDSPILLALHGAGDNVDCAMMREAFDGLPDLCAWLVIPQGVTTWSGDDWHTWGLADAEAAIKSIPTWIQDNNWNGQGVAMDRWIVVGHSNGGQGAWHTIIHRLVLQVVYLDCPNLNRNQYVVAGAPISGYLSVPGTVLFLHCGEINS